MSVFAAVAVLAGGLLMALSTQLDPEAPFILAAVLLALALPAVVLTGRQSGRAGVRGLLRDAVRLPRPWWWLPAAAFTLPALSWPVAAALGGARPMSWQLLAGYALDLAVTAVVVNIWEEMAWTGYFQRRATVRWGAAAGALVTAALFTGFHVPLAVDERLDVGTTVTNVLVVAMVAAAVRLVIGRLDRWSGGSLLTVGVFHASFNASETVLTPAYDWVRIVVVVAVAVVLVGFVRAPGVSGGHRYRTALWRTTWSDDGSPRSVTHPRRSSSQTSPGS